MTKERVILVHGTGATAPSSEGSAWWQNAGELWTWADDAGYDVEAFIWSGANDEAARRIAGQSLARRMQQLDQEGVGFHLIGHSHGGSVIWHAILQLAALDRIAASRALVSWSSVGTPFMEYSPRRPAMYLATVTVIACAAALVLVIVSLAGVELRYAMRDEPFYLLGWLITASIPAALSVCGIRGLVPFMRFAKARKSVPPETVEAIGAAKYLCIWSTQDEPIIGLAASGSFGIQFVSSTPVDDRTRGGKRRKRLVATAINQFVNNILSRKVQGSSLDHLELRSVFTSPHPALAHEPLPAEVDNEIIANANSAAASLGMRVRELLLAGRDPVTGFEDLQSAAAGAFTFKELVHTSYFQSKACVDLIKHHVKFTSKRQPPNTSQPTDLPACAEWYSSRFVHPRTGAAGTGVPPLPSNQVGHAVALSMAALVFLLSLAALAQESLHAIALKPTTAAHQLRTVINAANIGSALADSSPEEVSPTGLAYLSSIAHADQIPLLMRVAVQEAPPHLTQYFQSNGMAPLLRVANAKQIVWLLENYGNQFVKYVRVPGYEDQISSLAPLIEAVRGLASEGALNEHSFVLLNAACGGNAICVRVIGNEAAREILQRGRSLPPYVLPHPQEVPAARLHSSCRDNLGIGDCSSPAPPQRAERAKAAKRFWGPGGALSVLSPVATAAPISSSEFEIAVSSLRAHLCLPMQDRGSPDINDEDRLSRVFRLAPKEALARPALDEWISIINSEKDLCAQARSTFASADVSGAAAWFTLAVADWVARFDPALARDMVVPRQAQDRRPLLVEERTYWLLEHGYVADALKLVASERLMLDPLVARAAYFEMAACLQISCKSDDAESLAKGAQAIGPFQRNFAREIVTIARAEAMYSISRRDWRTAFKACDSCNAGDKILFSSSMLQFATSNALHELFRRQLSCPHDLDAAKPSVSEVNFQAGRS